ncbi:protein of unknown function [Streptomyces sp. KY70]|nr:protein of unknown function [Streptomyces sp. KY70]
MLHPDDMEAGPVGDPGPRVPQGLVSLGAEQRGVLGDAGGDPLVESVHRLVHRVLGHDPVRRVLAARHDDEAGGGVGDGVLARQLAGGVRLTGQQRAQPGVDTLDVVPGQRGVEDGVHVFEQVVDIGAGGGRVGLVQVPVGVRGADDPVPAPGDHEEDGLLGTEDEAGGGVDAVLGDDEVDALGGPDVELSALVDEPLGVVGPHAGRVDDLLGPDLVLLATLDVLHERAHHPLALAEEADDPGAVGDLGAVGGGGADELGDEAGVVHLGVVILQRADQGVLLQRGGDAQGVLAGEVAVDGEAPAVARGDRHRVVERDAGARVEPLPPLVLQRVEEGHRLHQVRCEPLQQQPALLQRLAHQGEVQHLQIAQPAVDQLARPAGCAGRPVARLDQAGRESSGGGVQRRARADDARPHDQHVQFALGHGGERGGALGGSQCRCPHCCLPVDRGGRTRECHPAEGPAARVHPSILSALPDFSHRLWTTPGRQASRNATYRSYLRLV